MNSIARRWSGLVLMLGSGSNALLLSHCGGGARPQGAMVSGSAGAKSASCQALEAAPPPPVLDCASAAAGKLPRLDDFDDENLLLAPVEDRVGTWYDFSDGTAGCANLKVENVASSPALHFTGSGFSKWGAAFGVALAWSMSQNGLCTYDLSAYSGIRFRARGNATVRMNVASRESAFKSAGGDCADSEGCFDQQGRNIPLSSNFQEFEVPFCSLAQRGFGAPLGPLDRSKVTNLNFLVQSTSSFDVWVDDLEFIPWGDGQARDCSVVCPVDELGLGITPRPGETALDQKATGVRLFTFEQPTKNCGAITRRYLSYVPQSLAGRSDAPVLIVLHGMGADAESMRGFITQTRFETLAEREKFIVVYGNAAPGSATVVERPNGGGFRKDLSGRSQVDDFAYLQRIIDDLTAHGAISGNNPVFLAGLSDGGGMAHMAALHDPTRYRGIAELMPYPGTFVPMPDPSTGFALRRVLLGYSLADPAMSEGYATLLAPLGAAWAAALGLSPAERAAPRASALPDLVNEGADYRGTVAKALRTRDSQAEQFDYGGPGATAQVRVLRFDHAGHLWPVPSPFEPEQVLAEFGFRNRDVDMSDVVWDFFRSSL